MFVLPVQRWPTFVLVLVWQTSVAVSRREYLSAIQPPEKSKPDETGKAGFESWKNLAKQVVKPEISRSHSSKRTKSKRTSSRSQKASRSKRQSRSREASTEDTNAGKPKSGGRSRSPEASANATKDTNVTKDTNAREPKFGGRSRSPEASANAIQDINAMRLLGKTKSDEKGLADNKGRFLDTKRRVASWDSQHLEPSRSKTRTQYDDKSDAIKRKNHYFTISFGALKLDGLLPTPRAVQMISERLRAPSDDLVAFFETNTNCNQSALWSQLRKELVGTEREYEDPVSEKHCAETRDGNYYALSVFKSLYSKLDLKINPVTEVCCRASKGAKASLLRTVTVGDTGELLIVGVAFSATDRIKARQIVSLQKEITTRRAAAAATGRTLQVVFAGDVNNRLVLPADYGTIAKTRMGKKNSTISTRRLDSTSVKKVTRSLAGGRPSKSLLDWDAMRFEGMAAGNVKYSPDKTAQEFFSKITLMTDWWKQSDVPAEMITYKRRPWFDQVEETFMDWMKAKQPAVPSKDGRMITTWPELREHRRSYLNHVCLAFENKDLRNRCRSDHDMPIFESARTFFAGKTAKELKKLLSDWSGMQKERVFFSMASQIAKTTEQSKHVQQYLNHDGKGNAVYLQAGWLDVVGFGNDGFPVKQFISFKSHFDVWAFDHLFVSARLAFKAPDDKLEA